MSIPEADEHDSTKNGPLSAEVGDQDHSGPKNAASPPFSRGVSFTSDEHPPPPPPVALLTRADMSADSPVASRDTGSVHSGINIF